MKKAAIMITVLGLVLFVGCKDEGPTVFEGKVVNVEDGTPFTNGKVRFSTYGDLLTKVLSDKEINLDDSGRFRASVGHVEDGRFIQIGIIPNPPKLVPYLQIYGSLKCSKYDCDQFDTGKTYKNLVLKVSKK